LIVRFIDEQRAEGRGVESICRVLREQGLQVAPRSYRAWKTNPPSTRTVHDAQVVDKLRSLRTGGVNGRPLPEVLYGRRKMTAWLRRNGFANVSKHTVDRLMRQEGMRGLVRGRKTRTTITAKDGKRARDLLNRQFRTGAPNRAWVTDFTYCPAWSGFTYVAFAIDLYSRAIVGWSASITKDVAFIESCLAMALWRRDHTGRPVSAGMIHHSDAGSQYTSVRFTETLALEGLSASIGTVGDAYDNAVAESVFGLFKNEAIAAGSPFRTGPLRTLADVEAITLNYVDWYNNRRLHSLLSNTTPEEFEQAYYAHQTGSPTGAAANEKTA
jgi:transposase InsO family protein